MSKKNSQETLLMSKFELSLTNFGKYETLLICYFSIEYQSSMHFDHGLDRFYITPEICELENNLVYCDQSDSGMLKLNEKSNIFLSKRFFSTKKSPFAYFHSKRP